MDSLCDAKEQYNQVVDSAAVVLETHFNLDKVHGIFTATKTKAKKPYRTYRTGRLWRCAMTVVQILLLINILLFFIMIMFI